MACLVVSSTDIQAQLLAGLLAQCAAVPIAVACGSVAAALEAIDRRRPDLVILDRDGDGEGCERIARHLLSASPGTRLILLSCDPRLEPLRCELAARIDQPDSWQALLTCVRACDLGRAPLLDPLPDQARFASLRPREREVLELLGSGLASRAIASALGVSLQTIETYRKSLSAKLGVSGARLVRVAVLWSCIQFGPLSCPGEGLNPDGQCDRIGRSCVVSALQAARGRGSGEAAHAPRV